MKKKTVFAIVILTSIILTFGISKIYKQNSDIIHNTEDYNHQKDFNLHFRSYTLVKPDSVCFASECAPIYAEDIWERYDKEIHKNVYWQSNTMFYFKRANKYFPIIEPILLKNNIPNDFKYLAVIESGLENVVSPSGAAGFWQFMKGTAKDYKLEVNSEVDERYNLEKSTQAACEYLNKAYDKFGNWTMAAASYNVGMYGLDDKTTEQMTNNYYNLYLNDETSRYIFRILAVKEIFENKKKYGFHIREKDLYKPIQMKKVELKQSNVNLSELSNSLGINYKILKQLNPWLRSQTLINKNQKKYIINIPFSTNDINIFNNY